MRILGIDPGDSGGMVLLGDNGDIIDRVAFSKITEHDTAGAIEEWQEEGCVAWIEHVHAMPKQGIASTFKFGRHCGFLIGLLTALRVPYEQVTPVKWQTAMRCRSKGDKRVTRAAAQRRWPKLKWTHALSDAALIAEYGRTHSL